MRNKGITIIALIITIVILLILAGITIGTLTGENGLIKNSNNAKLENEIANEKEILEQATIEAMGKEKYGNLNKDNLEEVMNRLVGEGKTEISDLGEEFEVTFIDSKRYYEVDKNGNVGNYQIEVQDKYPGDITKDENGNELEGTEEKPYEVNCIEDLIEWSQNYTMYNSKHIILKRNLNFKSKYSYSNSASLEYGDINEDGKEEKIIEEMQTGIGFRPIDLFSNGTFDGKEYKIENIYVNVDGYAGLFARINKSTIKNLTITGKIEGTKSAGAIAGGVYNRISGRIENCINYAEVKGNIMVGGIIGLGKEIENCKNYGDVTIKGCDYPYGGAGGIVGYESNEEEDIVNCYNKGTVTGMYVCGGIVGTMENGSIKNCKNEGKVTSIGNYSAGGILGFHRGENMEITNCSNTGAIGETSTFCAGGIIGNDTGVAYTSNKNLNVYNSYNTGSIEGQGFLGGILGVQGRVVLTSYFNIENCYTIGKINGSKGGNIVGQIMTSDDRSTLSSQIINTYRMTTTPLKDVYLGECTEKCNVGTIDSANTQEFIDILNQNRTQSSWSKWILESEGYAILETEKNLKLN